MRRNPFILKVEKEDFDSFYSYLKDSSLLDNVIYKCSEGFIEISAKSVPLFLDLFEEDNVKIRMISSILISNLGRDSLRYLAADFEKSLNSNLTRRIEGILNVCRLLGFSNKTIIHLFLRSLNSERKEIVLTALKIIPFTSLAEEEPIIEMLISLSGSSFEEISEASLINLAKSKKRSDNDMKELLLKNNYEKYIKFKNS